MAPLIGSRILRIEDEPLLRGKARFIDDIVVPDVLHAAFVRSPHAHAAIKGVDKTAALAVPGVHAVLTLDDLAPVMAQRRMMRHSNSGTPLDNMWSLRARRRRGVLCRRVRRHRDRRQPLHRRGRRRAGRCRLRPAAGGFGLPQGRAAGRAGGAARAQVQYRRDLQGQFRRLAGRLRQGRACLSREPLAAPRRRPSDRGPRHPRRISARRQFHHGLGLDAEGA